jgi:type I restriction enzyme, R subunit
VIVVSDRRVIDGQLQEALFDFQRTTGVVETIKSESGSKSGQLAQALAAGKKIIVCTIQTSSFALEAVRALAATEGKRFAVLADEAHILLGPARLYEALRDRADTTKKSEGAGLI